MLIAAEAANSDNYWKMTKRYADDLVKLVKDSGVKVVVTPKDILAEQMKSWDKVVADFSAKDADFREVILGLLESNYDVVRQDRPESGYWVDALLRPLTK